MIDTDLLTANEKFRYAMLGRLQSDCEYYLNWGNKKTPLDRKCKRPNNDNGVII